MTAVFQVGRCELGRNPRSIDQDGDRTAISGFFQGASLAAAKVIRQQLLGLNEETVVPLIWAADTDLTGFYRVNRATVTPILGVSYERFGFDYALDLTRVGGGYATPAQEIVEVRATRSVVTSGVSPAKYTWFPADHIWQNMTRTQLVSNFITRTTATGVITTGGVGLSGSGGTSGSGTYAIAPANFHKASALVEAKVGSVWSPVVGKQLPTVALTGDVRISNGLVRLTIQADGDLELEVYDSATETWDSLGDFVVKGDNRDDWATTSPSPPVVVRNDVESCTLRYQLQTDQTVSFQTYRLAGTLDVTVSRGDQHASMTCSGLGSSGVTRYLGLWAKSSTSGTSITGGVRRSDTTAEGHMWAMGSDGVITKDTATGGFHVDVTVATSTTADMFLGAAINSTDAQSVANEWWNAAGRTQRVVEQ
jgi:hypothetical protein